jgi:hypothetical protein
MPAKYRMSEVLGYKLGKAVRADSDALFDGSAWRLREFDGSLINDVCIK